MAETFTALQKHTALKREIAQRHRVYEAEEAAGRLL